MSLIAYFPLNGNITNYAKQSTITMSALGSSTLTGAGRVTTNCYSNGSYTDGGYVSGQTISLGQNQSMFCWMKFTSLTSDSNLGGSIVGQHRYPNNTGMGITLKYVSSTTGYLSVNTGNGSSRTFNTYCGSTLLQAGTWYHVGYTYDGATIKLYVNGAVDGIHAFTGMSVPADYLMIGCWSFANTTGNGVYGNYKLVGFINDVRVFNHTCTDAEVSKMALGNMMSIKDINDVASDLFLHYKFNFEDLYQPIEYIQSTGTQYIDTGITPSASNILEIQMDIKLNGTTGDQTLFGISTENHYCLNAMTGSSTWQFGTSNGWSNLTDSSTCNTNRHIILCHYQIGSQYVNIDGTRKITVSSSPSGDGTNLRLFNHYNRYWTLGNLYSCQIWNGGSLVRDYIPVLRKSDNKPGLYDIVNNVFYTNSGTGEFTIPQEYMYERLDYIDQINPAAGATSQHNRCQIPSIQYDSIEAGLNVNGSGSSGGIMLAGYDGSWWKSWQGGGTGTITMTPSSLTQNVWYDVKYNCGTTYTGIWTSGWSDGTNYWTPQSLKVRYIKLYKSGDMTANLIPVRRIDGALGLYDLIGNAFYSNTGTGTFSYGEGSRCIPDNSGNGHKALIIGSVPAITDVPVGSNGLSLMDNLVGYLDLGTGTLTGITNGTITFWAKYTTTDLKMLFGSNDEGNRFFIAETPDGSSYSGNWYSGYCSHGTAYCDGEAYSKPKIDSQWHFYSFVGVNFASWGNYKYFLCTYASSPSNSFQFHGQIADLRVYGAPLSTNDINNLYKAKALVDDKGSLYVNSYREKDSTKFSVTSNSITETNLFDECISLDDGSMWVSICTHYVPDGLFTFNSGSDSTNPFYGTNYVSRFRYTNFGLINTLERPESGYYEFMVKQQATVGGAWTTYRWKQNINPFSATWDSIKPATVGTNVIKISPSSGSSGGMYWFHQSNCQMCFANSSNGNWFGCGISAYHNSGIPSYENSVAKGWQITYMRVTKNQFLDFSNQIKTYQLKEVL